MRGHCNRDLCVHSSRGGGCECDCQTCCDAMFTEANPCIGGRRPTLRDKILAVLEAHGSLCMDDEADRERLATGLVIALD